MARDAATAISAGDGEDVVYGGAGLTRCIGTDGSDVLVGHGGNDTLAGWRRSRISSWVVRATTTCTATGSTEAGAATIFSMAAPATTISSGLRQRYLFLRRGRRAGRSTIEGDGWNGNFDPTTNKMDVLQFKRKACSQV